MRIDGSVVCGQSITGDAPDGPFHSVSVGFGHACAIRESGEVLCWPSEVDFNGDGRGSPEGRFVEIAAHEQFTCGVRVGGAVDCWGAERNTTCHFYHPATCRGWGNDPLPGGSFIAIGVAHPRGGDGTVCGVREGGGIRCWNDNQSYWGPPPGRFVTVHVNGGVVCGTRLGGQVACWGPIDWLDEVPPGAFTTAAGSRTHGCGLRSGGHVECWGSNSWAAAAPPPGRFTAIDVGAHVTCGIRADGQARCWGQDVGGEPPAGPFNAVDVVDTYDGTYACARHADGAAECWGRRSIVRRITPEALELLFSVPDFEAAPWRDSYPGGTFESLSVSGAHACGVRADGRVLCWSPLWPPGAGDEPTEQEPREPRVGVPRSLAWVQGDITGGPLEALSSGWYHTCGRRPDDTVVCWGDVKLSVVGSFRSVDTDWTEACGIGTDGQRRCWSLSREGDIHPRLIAAIAPEENVVDFQRGHRVHCVLLAGGAIVCEDILDGAIERREGPYEQFSVGWGLIVDPDAEGSMNPARSNSGPGYSVYSSGDATENNTHVCALRRGGTLDCWGSNTSGQTQLPAPWLDNPPYRVITAGFAHTCAIDNNGDAICWGDDRYDQTRSPPGPYTAISAGQWHTCALRADGDISCWGNGTADHTQNFDRPSPGHPTEPPPGPYTAISAGQWHTCALRPDGTATCWLSY